MRGIQGYLAHKKRNTLGPYRRPMRRVLGGSYLSGAEVELFRERLHLVAGGGVRIHPENAHMRVRYGVQYVAQFVACAALTLVVRQ